MGTWGMGIFDNDLASDMRATYLDMIITSTSPDDAAQQTQQRFSSALHDSDESVAFWLALGAIQSQFGRVTEDVRKQTLEVIASGQDEKRWSEASMEDQQTRRKTLEELKEKLTKPT